MSVNCAPLSNASPVHNEIIDDDDDTTEYNTALKLTTGPKVRSTLIQFVSLLLSGTLTVVLSFIRNYFVRKSLTAANQLQYLYLKDRNEHL